MTQDWIRHLASTGLALGVLAASPAFSQSTPATVQPVLPTQAQAQAQAPYQPQNPAANAPASPVAPNAAALASPAPAVAAPAVAAVAPAPGAAITAAAPTAAASDDLMGSFQIETKLRQSDAAPQADESVFFTPWQHALLQEAKRGFLTRPSGGAAGGAAANQPPAMREISLGGIVYRAPKDWTIYLNNQRVTAAALPDQVMDLKVRDNYIDIKWFDTATNLIFPIRLRPYQRFNLDARMFLPGVGVETANAAPVTSAPAAPQTPAPMINTYRP